MAHLSRQLNGRIAVPVAGFLATAVAFGPARMGFGLFLPQFRDSFEISTDMAGLISSVAFAAFFAALPIGADLLNRKGPRAPVLVGGVAATLGLGLVALAETVAVLATGVALAASSAGFCWTPYNNAAERIVNRNERSRALSVISTGTTIGTTLAGALALAIALNGLDWRLAWAAFAAGALVMTLVNVAALHPVAGKPGGTADASAGLRDLKRPDAVPLMAGAISFGLTSAVYLSFAVDHATTAGALAYGPLDSAAPLLFVGFGIVGLVGLFAGDMENRIGLVALLRLTFLASALSFALLAVMPGVGWVVLLSAGLQGAVVMVTSAIFSFWSARLFPQIPSVSFTAVLTVVAAGSVFGPALAGWAGTTLGLDRVFLAAAAVAVSTPLFMDPRQVEKVSSRPWRPGRRSRTIYPAPDPDQDASRAA